MNKKAFLFLLPVRLLLAVTAVLAIIGNVGSTDTENPDAAESVRNIYIGDIISLKVTSLSIKAEELQNMFQDFEIVEIKQEPDGYLLSLRTFKTGERKVLLGNKEIIINVSSTLDDIERESIFEGDTWVIKPGILFYWRILLYVAAGVFALSGGFVLVSVIKKRKAKALSPLQLFIKRSSALSADDDFNDNYFVDLTFYFKEYLEARHQCRITSEGASAGTIGYIGKTSVEIINELMKIQALDAFIPEIHGWLTECDRMKFTGMEVSAENKKGHCAILIDLVERIDLINKDINSDFASGKMNKETT
jgi:hypothetical protein